MIFFRSDYSQGAHPAVLDALVKTNYEHTDGYGCDIHCENAINAVKKLIGDDKANVFMMVGGTPCNITYIAAALKPYEAVISARTGHIYSHETGGVEATGHRIITVDGIDGKLTPELIDRAYSEYEDEHTPLPKMVYLSQPTEIGTIYSKSEMTAIAEKCKEKDLLLYVDGARLGSALTSKANDLSIKELASLADAFYIGGTKNGALFGEALVIKSDDITSHFRFMMKRECGLLAKGRLIGVQFEALLSGETPLYYEIASHSNALADRLRDGLKELGVEFCGSSPTNQIFPIFAPSVVEELKKDFFFYEWPSDRTDMQAIRLVTSWGSTEDDVDAFLSRVRELIG